MALAVSGLPTDRFSFEGFLPRKHGERVTLFRSLVDERRTMVFFESPHRIGDSLADLVEAMGPERRVVVCRELTKMFEEVRRGTAAELAEWAADGLRGEICLVVEGAPEREASLEDGLADVLERVAAGARLKEASAEVAEITGLSKRALYEAALASRRG
jgi:16S rRNA (cytidine1402-2'-O)-methyltransferase